MWIKNKKIIFLHISKTGGSSIEAKLRQTSGFSCRPQCGPDHRTLEQIKNSLSSNEKLGEYIIFLVLRHPIERLVSTFNWQMADTWECKKIYFNTYIDFIKLYYENKLKSISPNIFVDKDNKRVISANAVRQLQNWINIEDELAFEDLELVYKNGLPTLSNKEYCIYLLRFNKLNIDWIKFRKIINITGELPHNLPSKIKVKKDEYLQYYNTENKSFILEKYDEEIKLIRKING